MEASAAQLPEPDPSLSHDTTWSTHEAYTPGDLGEPVPTPAPGPAVTETRGVPGGAVTATKSSKSSSS